MPRLRDSTSSAELAEISDGDAVDEDTSQDLSASFHWVAMLLWLVVGGFVTWRHPDSVAWVAFMSLYANIVGHWGAAQAARAEKKMEEKIE